MVWMSAGKIEAQNRPLKARKLKKYIIIHHAWQVYSAADQCGRGIPRIFSEEPLCSADCFLPEQMGAARPDAAAIDAGPQRGRHCGTSTLRVMDEDKIIIKKLAV
jgi:hypothetical protein